MKLLVNIATGNIIHPGFIKEASGIHAESRFWYPEQLTAKGIPDARKAGQPIGVFVPLRPEHDYWGKVAYFNPEIEAKANLIRDNIDELRAALKKAEKDLLLTYLSDPQNKVERKF